MQSRLVPTGQGTGELKKIPVKLIFCVLPSKTDTNVPSARESVAENGNRTE